MKKKHLHLAIAMLVIKLLAGCTQTASSGSPAASSISIPNSTATIRSVTDTPIPLPTATLQLATPDFLNSAAYPGFLLAPNDDPSCELPCWKGLRIGQSDRQDFQRVLDESFGFNRTLDFFQHNPLSGADLSLVALDIPGTEATGYSWYPLPEGHISIFALFDQDTGLLKGMRFQYLVYQETYLTHTVQQIIERLGRPSEIYAYATDGFLSLIMVYESGLAFDSAYYAPKQQRTLNGNEVYYSNFCLDTMSFGGVDNVVESFKMPLTRGSMTAIQDKWVGQNLQTLYPIKIALGVSVEEFAQIALRKVDPCFEIDFGTIP